MKVHIIKKEIKVLAGIIDMEPLERNEHLQTMSKTKLISLARQLCGYIEGRENYIKELRNQTRIFTKDRK